MRRGARHHGPVPRASPTTAWAWATTARSGAARSSSRTCVGYRRLGALRAGADARRRARGEAAVPDGAGLPARRPRRRSDDGTARPSTAPSSPTSAAAFLARLDPREVGVVRTQVARRLNAPVASSAGRLFDAAAALLGLRDVAEYEAQAAIDLEIAAGERVGGGRCPYRLDRVDGLLVYDPRPTLAALLEGAGGRPRRRRRSRPRSRRRSRRSPGSCCADARRATGLRYRLPLGRRVPEPPPRVDAAAPARPATASRCSSTARSPSTTAASATARRPSRRPGWLAGRGPSPAPRRGGADAMCLGIPGQGHRDPRRRPACRWARSTSAACARTPASPTCRGRSSATTSSSTSASPSAGSTRRRRSRRSRSWPRWATWCPELATMGPGMDEPGGRLDDAPGALAVDPARRLAAGPPA